MNATHPPGARVRWLVAGAFQPRPSGRRFLLTEDSFAEHLRRAASGLCVTVEDRIGLGDVSSYAVSFDGLSAFQLSAVIDSQPSLRALRGAHAADSPLAEALFATARDILQHPLVARLESAWRGLHWLWTHCPASAGLDIEVLDVAPHQRVEALEACLDAPPLQRPDACFLLDASDDGDTLHQLAALGEQAWVPLVAAVPPSLPGDGAAEPTEAWRRLRADEASRWLCAALNPVVMLAEQEGAVRRECFTSPVLAVAALLAASFRDTHTFARMVGPGSATRAPAVWRPQGGARVATEAGLSLHEQQRLAARGLLGVSGWWDSNAVLLAAAPTVYGGREAVTLPTQLLTGRLVRLALELVERLPSGASQEAVATFFSRAAEALFSAGPGRSCQLHGRLVSTGNGERGVHVRASLPPELAGSRVQLELTLPLRGGG
jgi:type VI secretion system protein ImpC